LTPVGGGGGASDTSIPENYYREKLYQMLKEHGYDVTTEVPVEFAAVQRPVDLNRPIVEHDPNNPKKGSDGPTVLV
jgi:hypothetical protein